MSQILRILFVVALMAMCSRNAVAEDSCAFYNGKHGIVAKDLSDSRIMRLVEKVANASGLTGERMPLICEGWRVLFGRTPAIVPLEYRAGGRIHLVLLPREVHSYPEAALFGIIAHEFGHIGAGSLTRLILDYDGYIEREKRADAKAAQWVGKKVMLDTLIATRDELVATLDSSRRNQMLQEMHDRIDAIRVLPD